MLAIVEMKLFKVITIKLRYEEFNKIKMKNIKLKKSKLFDKQN